jgi:hypothetical protein
MEILLNREPVVLAYHHKFLVITVNLWKVGIRCKDSPIKRNTQGHCPADQ